MITFPDTEFTIGIEEEYYLVDPISRDLIETVPAELWEKLKKDVGDVATKEFLQCQVEIGTPKCRHIKQAREELGHLRASVSEIAEQFDMKLIAASIHPFAKSGNQHLTDKERYYALEQDLQEVARRMLISGMHVHVGIDDENLRLDLMSQATYILPHLLGLSTSSPFWKGKDTGLKSYRISVWNEMPRTGLPESFESYAEYQRHVDVLIDAGIIEDSTKIWWDIRPSHRFPTVEMRITDICTNIDDSICIAAIYICWMRMLSRLRIRNQKWRRYSNFLINENRWRAHRYGIDEGLIDFGAGKVVAYADLIDEMVELIREDAVALDCEAQVQHVYNILARGTSAHGQLAQYQKAIDEGSSEDEALKSVVDWLIEQTISGCSKKQ